MVPPIDSNITTEHTSWQRQPQHAAGVTYTHLKCQIPAEAREQHRILFQHMDHQKDKYRACSFIARALGVGGPTVAASLVSISTLFQDKRLHTSSCLLYSLTASLAKAVFQIYKAIVRAIVSCMHVQPPCNVFNGLTETDW